jgi:hypothetical protein
MSADVVREDEPLAKRVRAKVKALIEARADDPSAGPAE